MNEQEILDNAPDDGWTHFEKGGFYYRKDGSRLNVWITHTSSWSVPLVEEMRYLRSREDISRIAELESDKYTLARTYNQLFDQYQRLEEENLKTKSGTENNEL